MMMEEMLRVVAEAVAEAETFAKSTEKTAVFATNLIATDPTVALASAKSACTVALSFENNGPLPNHKLGTGTCPFESAEAHSRPRKRIPRDGPAPRALSNATNVDDWTGVLLEPLAQLDELRLVS
jgi:hypothetical protein